MRRRQFLNLLGGLTVYPGVGLAQQDGQTRRVGVLTGNTEADAGAQARVQAFREMLAERGWAQGRNLRIDVRWPGPDVARQQNYARELVASGPEVIMATSTRTVQALRDATRTIPIVFVGLSDPIATGVVANLARPGANITGFMLYEHSLAGKWVSLLKDIVPQLGHVGVFFNPDTSPYAPFYVRTAEEIGKSLAVKVTAASVRNTEEIEPAIASMAGTEKGGLVVIPDGGFTALNISTVIAFAAKYRVPAIYAVRLYVAKGGLLSYAADLTRQFRDGATYVDRILRGAKPADLPVQFATNFNTAINLKTAKALDLTIPLHLMIGAEVFR